MIIGLAITGVFLIGRGLVPTETQTLEGPNIIVVTLCSVRADRIREDYGRDLTPNLATLANRGWRFNQAYTNATTTLPAHASLLTGLLPDRHGVIDFETRLNSALPSLPGVLRLYGYRSAWGLESDRSRIAGGQSSGVAPAGLGQAQGFLDAFDTQFYLNRDGDGLDVFASWLTSDSRPFFALVLLRSAHVPYGDGEPFEADLDPRVTEWLQPPAVQRPGATLRSERSPAGDREARRMREFLGELKADDSVRRSLDAAYDSGVADVDRLLGQLLGVLDSTNQRDNTIVVVVGDHGESLGEEGRLGHDNTLNEAVIRVPLVWSDPEGDRIGLNPDLDVSLVDIMPTLLARTGATVPVGLDGRDLGSASSSENGGFAEPVRTQAAALPGMVQRRAVASGSQLDEVVSSGDLRVMFSSNDGAVAHRRDSGSLVEVALDSPSVQALMSWKQRSDRDRRQGKAERVTLSEETIRQLQEEGYW